MIEVYEGSDFAGIPTRYEKSDASFSLLLNKESQYMFLFWADYGTPDGDESNDCYNTASLKAVAPTDDAQKAEPAYFGKSETAITPSSSTPVTATLTHAVAKVILENIAGLVESTNSLEAVYPNYGSFDASTSGPATASGTITRTYNDIGAEAGVIVTDYILAPAEKELTNFSFTLNNEDAKAIGNVPLQINYATRIKGTFSNLYSTTFTIDQEGIEWIEDEGNDPDYNPNY
ncbi:hypothetical protein [Bacteroides sp. 519]|uniref:hypothetical protein n=1 Tax=Bacteroides sp. 519 TaxID=2302937 RepID=UPI0013D65E97|nr:hypothetical protein [Bacteroides sp. 519]